MEKTPKISVQAFGNYYLLERIAVGGMAEIFKAKHYGARGFEKTVVIKKILQSLSEDPEFVEMFEDEAKIAAQLSQANIVQIFELGEVQDTLYITMEYVEGRNLRDVTKNISSQGMHLSIEQTLYIISEVLKGLDFAHRKKDASGNDLEIIHRDMSPQNIILAYEGEVKILDFGIAKAASKISKTEAGVLKGKFSYMSPEQASGRTIDQRTDLFAVGVILYELLTSKRLFRSESDMETLEKVKQAEVQAPSEVNPLVPKRLDEITLKALQKDPEKRYQSAADFLNDLIQFIYQEGFTCSAQELSAFMKSLFAQQIQEERERLQEAIAQIPNSATSQLQRAKTHISFKAPHQKTPPPKQSTADEAEKSEITVTSYRKPAKRVALAASILLAISALILSLLWTEPHREQQQAEEQASSERKTREEPETSNESPPETELSLENLGNRDEESNTETEEEANIADDRSPLDDVLRFEYADPEENDREIVMLDPSPTEEAEEKNPALINVVAPQDGYATLFINNEEIGLIPGPNARNIQLSQGRHRIRCEAPNHIYEGEIQLEADDQNRDVYCDHLR